MKTKGLWNISYWKWGEGVVLLLIPLLICKLAEGMQVSHDEVIFRVTVPLWGEFTGQQWLPRKKASDAELWCFCLFSSAP